MILLYIILIVNIILLILILFLIKRRNLVRKDDLKSAENIAYLTKNQLETRLNKFEFRTNELSNNFIKGEIIGPEYAIKIIIPHYVYKISPTRFCVVAKQCIPNDFAPCENAISRRGILVSLKVPLSFSSRSRMILASG